MQANTTVPASAPAQFKLSICIPTYNRAAFIGETLRCLIEQATDECEIVVSDNASTDDTEQVVREFVARFERLRYIRQEDNRGLDGNYDRVVRLACGEYCWLMTDDDLLKPGAVAAVLEGTRQNPSLIIVGTDIRSFNLSKVVQRRWPDFESDRTYGPDELDRLFVEVGGTVNVNAIVIKRHIWLERDATRFYGTFLVHLGVVFQEPLPGNTLVIAEPYISYRTGNVQTYSPYVSAIIWEKWPWLVDTMAISELAKRKLDSPQPWCHFQELFVYRGRGFYGKSEYDRWVRPRLRSLHEIFIARLVALLPGTLVNALCIAFYSMTRIRYRGLWQPEIMVHWMRASRFHFRHLRILKLLQNRAALATARQPNGR